MSLPSTDSSFPTSISEITFSNANSHINQSIYKTLNTLRKSTLSIPNRLRSILEDSEFVASYFASRSEYSHFPLIANERCGSWYIPPDLKVGSAYFKSTDGHHGQWAFSQRRLNLDLLEVLGTNGGAVLIDSTRRGKTLPDALRRTVPIWVAVWNRLLFPTCKKDKFGNSCERCARRHDLQSRGLDRGEISQIQSQLDGWVDGVKGLGLDLETIKSKARKPIRCIWVVHGEGEIVPDGWNVEDVHNCGTDSHDWNTLVLCSASRRVVGAEMSEDGYIQGASDDSEGWSCGLTPTIFWKHKDTLLNTTQEDLPDLIQQYLKDEQATARSLHAVQIFPTTNLFIAAGGGVASGQQQPTYGLVINCDGSTTSDSKEVIVLRCRAGKLGSKDLRERLGQAESAAFQALHKAPDSKILVQCTSGKDLSIGVAVTLLCLFYDGNGRLDLESKKHTITKQLIKQRLAWITTCKPDANPSRSTLQAVNSFLMERPP